MSVPAPQSPAPPAVSEPSFQDVLAQRFRERRRAREKLVVVPLNGPVEDLFAAQYRRLSYEEKIQIANRHDGIGEDAGKMVAASADTLIMACQDLLQIVGRDEAGEPQYKSLESKWNAPTIARLFQVDLPEKATGRAAMLAAFDHEDLADHFRDYTRAIEALDKDEADVTPGESKPSAEGFSD